MRSLSLAGLFLVLAGSSACVVGDIDDESSDTGNGSSEESEVTDDADSGDADSGDADSGDADSGDADSGDGDSGDADSGDGDSGDGDGDSGDGDGDGDGDSGDGDSGDGDSGDADGDGDGDGDSGDGDGDGEFACGDDLSCNLADEYCNILYAGPKGVPPSYDCGPIPAVCLADPSCICLENEEPGVLNGSCSGDAAVGLTVETFAP